MHPLLHRRVPSLGPLGLPALQILEGRSEKRQLGSRKGNNFSVAHFGAAAPDVELLPDEEAEAAAAAADAEAAAAQPVDARAFWEGLMPEAVAAHIAAQQATREPEVCARDSTRLLRSSTACCCCCITVHLFSMTCGSQPFSSAGCGLKPRVPYSTCLLCNTSFAPTPPASSADAHPTVNPAP